MPSVPPAGHAPANLSAVMPTATRPAAIRPATFALRAAAERGHTRTAWLESRHSFSFGGYLDPRWMGFGALRIINDDRVEPGAGFPTHGHRDMEILTFVLDGALEHRDSTGGGGILVPGQVQVMSAGRGIEHSEFNASKDQRTRFLQVWIEPASTAGTAAYHERDFGANDRGRWCLVASRDGREGSLPLLQDASVYSAQVEVGAALFHRINPGRRVWLQIATGTYEVGGLVLEPGDGVFSRGPEGGELDLVARAAGRVFLFDLS